MKLETDQKLIRIGNQAGKPPIAYIVGDTNGYLIGMSSKKGGRMEFFVHIAVFEKLWKPAKIQKKKSECSPEELTGKQGTIFPKKRTVREIYRDKTIKKI